MKGYHTPVLQDEVLQGLAIQPNAWYVDGTIGGGGYAVEILRSGGNVLGLDVDSEALAYTRKRFLEEVPEKTEKTNWQLVKGNFRNIEEIIKESGIPSPNGVLLDLGVSSHQLDTAARGMSYRFDEAPLDFRLDQEKGEPFSEALAHLTHEELTDILIRYGEEEQAGKIAGVLIHERREKPLLTVGDVLNVLEAKGLGNTLSRVFQAFRIYTNDELGALREGLSGGFTILPQNGILAVISFHSLEDRIVKQFFQKNSVHVVSKRPIEATEEEIVKNRRSRSAKLRIARKI